MCWEINIVRELLKIKENAFYLSYDNVKRNFSQYSPHNDKEKVFELLFYAASFIFTKNYDVVTDSLIWKDEREKIISLAHEAGYEIVEINLEADEFIFRKRFEERLVRSATSAVKPTNLSVNRWKELFDIYNADKNKQAFTFHTDVLSEEELVKKVFELFQ